MSGPGGDRLSAVTMPKWGMDAAAGTINEWLVAEGEPVDAGVDLVEVETTKIAGVIEAPAAGVLCRRVAGVGASVPVGGLIAVLGPHDAPAEAVDAFVAAFAGPGHADAAEAAAADVRVVDTATGPVRVRTLGEGGVPLVLVHGFGGDLDAWLFNHAALAERRVVHAVELPGHGESTKDVGDGGLDVLSAALGCALDALECARVHLAGHSLGGLVSLDFALASPARVERLALIASVGLGEEIDGGYVAGFVAAARRKEMRPLLGRLFADPALVTRRLVEDVLRHKRLDGAEAALARIAGAVFPDGRQAIVLAERLGDLRAPLAVVWGREDHIVPVAHAEALSGRFPVHVIDGAGHMVQMEAAGTVNRLLEGHLAG